MNQIREWGVHVICWLQQASPLLDVPMRIITTLGGGIFLAIVLFCVYLLDRVHGTRLVALFIFSSYIY